MIITNNFARKAPKIIDKVNLNNFGVLFHTMKSMELFQDKSGMAGEYSKEYQHHYWSAVGRLEIQGQRLDIAIPLCMVHYHQEVGGASVEFNLGEVGQASNAAQKLAVKKFEELIETPFYKAILEKAGITNWTLTPMNTFHAHPSGINRFSGTDLRENIDHPGVCYPLNTGTNTPNFAGIIQHKQGFAEIIHNEYRVFNATEDSDRIYEKGRCLTIVRGYETPPPPEPEFVGNGVIDTIFGTTRPQPPRPALEKQRKSFILKDGLSALEGKDFSEEFAKLWDECDFEVDTSLIDEDNVTVGRGRLLGQQTQYWGGQKKQSGSTLEEINEGLFGAGSYATHRNRKPNSPISQAEREMINYLTEKGYDTTELLDMTRKELEELYEIEQEAMNIDDSETDLIIDEEEMIETIAGDGIISLQKLMAMSPDAIRKLYKEIYGS